MGYRCPVCGDPQADDVHLANHLAFTAVVRGGDHESWLDEHVPDWGALDDDGLAAQVTDHAEQTEFPQVFEDTTDGESHDHGDGRGHETGGRAVPDRADLSEFEFDDEAEDIVAEARELTRQRRQNETDEENDDAEQGDDTE
jgi:hypothetical protein